MYLFLVILFLFVCIAIYQVTLNAFSYIDGAFSYETYLEHWIQVVSEDNHFMNYGFWDEEHTTLREANENLVSKILDMSELRARADATVLDVGCGYGEQDLMWIKGLSSGIHLTAIDISVQQIQAASSKNTDERVHFEQCDALEIAERFSAEQFDVVLSVESAFHYVDRPRFFKGVHTVLKPGGTFVICDIVCASKTPTLLQGLVIKLFSDFLSMPAKNLITGDVWDETLLSSGLELVEVRDITANTFNPYYRHFFNEYVRNKGFPSILGTGLAEFSCAAQPFSYRIAVCKKV
jgi:cyclopropane fatty-acyl-phospholipid synthase-like methyltransferase